MKRVLTVETVVQGERFLHYITLAKPDTGGQSYLSSATDLMVYGSRQDRSGGDMWHYYPLCNVVSYSVRNVI